MINFDEEVRKFKPSLEIDETDDAIRNSNENDMVDLMIELMAEYRDKN
ncbi:MAG: hypothetical protein J6Z23_05620 [Lachnospiraceae bacterium]|nr:hypothetical protein [Lachnospiraceae bacterium]MBP5254844.1 hypothetical protein [Lachnospiraceae bacterium]